MCGYFCIKFIDYMFDDKTLIDYTNTVLKRMIKLLKILLSIKKYKKMI